MWLLDRNGGEAQQFTDVKGRLSSYDWSPDGKKLLLVMADRDPNDPADDERPAGAAAARGAKAPKPIVIDRYKFKQDVRGVPDAAGRAALSVRCGDQEGRGADRGGAGSGVARVVARRQVDFVHRTLGQGCGALQHEQRVRDGGARGRRAAAVDAVRRRARLGVARACGVESRRHAGWCTCRATGAKQSAYNMTRLAVVPVAGGAPKILADKLDRGVSAPRFTPDGSSIVFLVADDRSEYPARVPASGGEVQRLIKGPLMISSMDQGKDGRLAVLAASDLKSGEVHALESGELRVLTHHNDSLMAEFNLGATEEFSCKAKDGNEVHGLMVKPPDYVAGRSIRRCCGFTADPTGRTAHSFNFERQLFAANGYVVVAVNYRGSSGRGEKYQAAISADWGNKEVLDLQAAMDHVVAIGVADPERLGVGGWSYGGILTDAMIAKDQRFKAATSGAGVAFPLALVRRGPVHHAVRRRDRRAVEGRAGAVDSDFVSVPACRPDQDADAVSRRREGFQRSAGGRRADVPGAAESGSADAVGDLSGTVSRDRASDVPEGSHGAISGLVRKVFEDGRRAGY